ncbi:MAG TPA: acetylglutamate kinase [Gammaproteobacteria bacterium]|nr:acetylglutamate kinase [Gammaproteobacteria bacterium]
MLIIKAGGGADINLEGIAADLAGLTEPFVVVLGANALRDRVAGQLGQAKVELTSVSGYTSVYSDQNAIDLIMMSYAGLRNRRFVEMCQRQGVNALGLTGLDGRLIEGARNRGIRVRDQGKTLLKRDFSGKPKRANGPLLELLLDNGYRPVLTIPIVDEQGFAINSENDDIVNTLQDALHAARIVQLIEAPGFLDNRDDPTSLVTQMSRAELEQREDQVTGRMKRKMLALRKLFAAGAAEVIIADGRVAQPVHEALAGKGTLIR